MWAKEAVDIYQVQEDSENSPCPQISSPLTTRPWLGMSFSIIPYELKSKGEGRYLRNKTVSQNIKKKKKKVVSRFTEILS